MMMPSQNVTPKSESCTEDITKERMLELAQKLINTHKRYDYVGEIIGTRLSPKEALYAGIVSARLLAEETAKAMWYRVATYLEDKYEEEYGQTKSSK